MLPASYYLLQRMIEHRVTEELRRAETRRLIRQAGIGPSRRRVRNIRLLLCHLGRRLVSLGRWLEQTYAPCCTCSGHVGK